MKKGKKIFLITALIIAIIAVLVVTAVFVVKGLSKKDTGPSAVERFEALAEANENVSYDEETGLLYINNEIIIIANEEAALDDMEELAEDYGAVITDSVEDIGFYLLNFEEQLSLGEIEDLVAEIKEETYVSGAYVNPVSEMSASARDESLPDDEDEETSVEDDKDKKTASKEVAEWEERDPVYPDDEWNDADWDVDVPRGENWGVEAINAPYAWAYMDELSEVNIGLIDSTVNTSHPDLDIEAYQITTDEKSNYYSVYQFESNETNSDDHGNHVAGIMGATWNNSVGISGVLNDKASLYFCDAVTLSQKDEEFVTSAYRYMSVYDFVKSIKFLVNNDVRAINISLGTELLSFAASHGNENAINVLETMADVAEPMLKRIINDIEINGGKDFVICIAAGNGNNDTYYIDSDATFGYITAKERGMRFWMKSETGNVDAKYSLFLNLIEDETVKDRIIVVGSAGIDYDNSSDSATRYIYSDFSNIGERVDIVAPGEEIYSLSAGSYVSMDGTSMAAPHVTAAAGYAFAMNPALTGPEVKDIIVNSFSERIYIGDIYRGLLDMKQIAEYSYISRGTNINRIVSTNKSSGLDICFLVDTTGSMNDDIENARTNMVNILNKVSEKSTNYRIALVDYRDFPSNSGYDVDYAAKTQLDFSNDNEQITSAINSLSLGAGGDTEETVYSAINEALTLSWRPRAHKVIIILGDAPPLDPEPVTGYTYDDVVNALYNADIGIDLESSDERVLGEPEDSLMSVYSIGTSANAEALEFFNSISSDTGGEATEVASADQVSEAIVSSIDSIEMNFCDVGTSFGDDFSNETVALFRDGEYLFSFKLDDKGDFPLIDMETGDYTWEINRLKKTGTLEINGDDDNITAEADNGPWYGFALNIWHRHKLVLFAIPFAIIIIVLIIMFIVSIIRKIKNRMKNPPAPKNSKICPVCNSVILPGSKFCENCGRPADSDKFICPDCHSEVTEGNMFCETCGRKLK